MTEVNGFNFKKYDVGGADAAANDHKLTGEEAQKARADGWTVWDGFSESNGTPAQARQQVQSQNIPAWAADFLKRLQSPENVDEAKTPGNLSEEDKNKIKDNLLKFINSVKVNGRPIEDVIAELTGKNDEKLTPEQKEARAELNSKTSSTGMTYAQAKAKIAEILEKYKDCYDEVEDIDNMQGDKEDVIRTVLQVTIKRKVFNPDKLPEPAKTEYKEAMASMAEIENNNSALAQKGGIQVTPIKIGTAKPSMQGLKGLLGDNVPEGIGFKRTESPEPTESQKSAREQLNEKISSTGISYKDAKATIENITNQYKNNPEYQSDFEREQLEGIYIYYPSVKAFDPYKLKGADKEVYFKALGAIHEIETKNYALLVKAGLEITQDPPIPQYNKFELY